MAGSGSGESRPAPRGLRPEEIALLVAQAAPVLIGGRVEKAFEDGPDAFILRLRAQGERYPLLFTTRPGFARFHVVEARTEATTVPPGERAMQLRELLTAGRVVGLDQPAGDRIVRLRLEVPRAGRMQARDVVLEMFGSRGRLLVLDEPGHLVRFVSGRGGAEVGAAYRYPDRPPRSDTLTAPFDPWRWLPDELREAPLGFHQALAAHMAAAELRAELLEEHARVERSLRGQVQRQGVLCKHLERDLAAAAGWQRHQQDGELLKAELGRLRRGMTQVEVIDYFDPAQGQRTIALDATLAPTENVEACFRRARKGRRGLIAVQERLAAAREQLARCEAALAELARGVESFAASPGALLPGGGKGTAASGSTAMPAGDASQDSARAALARAAALIPARRQRSGAPDSVRRSPAEAAARRGPRSYTSRAGQPILAGRSARENDELTLRIARGNDLFFHVAGRPGPHVILRVPRGTVAAPESIEDAAFVAAYLSGWRGPGSTRVHWTEVRWVRKRKGMPPGKVEVSREREFRVDFRPELKAVFERGDTEP